MSSGQKRALESDGVGETFQPPADLIRIAEEDPGHPHHAEHMARVAPTDPDMQALVASFREFGWRRSIVMSVYLDGDRYAVSDGRRRLTAVRIENARRKTERDKRGPIRPRVVVDDNPALTTTMTNSMRKDDPPMVKARRFVENSETMGASAAARAAGFLTLAEANACKAILSIPDASLHAAVNSGAVTVDTAARAAKKGGAVVRQVLTRARSSGGGKVTPEGAAKAVMATVAPRAKTKPAPVLASWESEIRNGIPETFGQDLDPTVERMRAYADGLAAAQGKAPPAWAVKFHESAEAARKAAKGGAS